MNAILLKHNENMVVPDEKLFNTSATCLFGQQKLFKFSSNNEIQQIEGIKVYKTGNASELSFDHQKALR